MSACMSYGFAVGKPIAALAVTQGASDLWKNLPVLIIVLAGGFTTNFIWCVALNLRNRTFGDYLRREEQIVSAENPVPRVASVPLLANYLLSALAGTLWYFQFFFYGMGTARRWAGTISPVGPCTWQALSFLERCWESAFRSGRESAGEPIG